MFFGLTPPDDNAYTKYIWREKHHFDLVICLVKRNGQEIDDVKMCIVEAKLKSLPDPEQLAKYDKKLKNNTTGQERDSELVFPIEGEFTQNDGIKQVILRDEKIYIKKIPANGKSQRSYNDTRWTCQKYILSHERQDINDWRAITWQEISKQLNDYAKDQSLIANTIEDYIKHLKNISIICNVVLTYSRSFSDKSSILNYEIFCNEINATDFKSKRLHDLVGKLAFSVLHEDIKKEINDTAKKLDANLRAKTFYTNQQPGVEFELEFDYTDKEESRKNRQEAIKKLRIGIQIQGNQYRHYLACDKSYSNLSTLAEQLRGRSSFFPKNQRDPDNPPNDKMHGTTRKQKGAFYVFDTNKFVYLMKEVGDKTFDKLLKDIIASLKEAQDAIGKAQHLNEP
jgi:hypothetical protein